MKLFIQSLTMILVVLSQGLVTILGLHNYRTYIFTKDEQSIKVQALLVTCARFSSEQRWLTVSHEDLCIPLLYMYKHMYNSVKAITIVQNTKHS